MSSRCSAASTRMELAASTMHREATHGLSPPKQAGCCAAKKAELSSAAVGPAQPTSRLCEYSADAVHVSNRQPGSRCFKQSPKSVRAERHAVKQAAQASQEQQHVIVEAYRVHRPRGRGNGRNEMLSSSLLAMGVHLMDGLMTQTTVGLVSQPASCRYKVCMHPS